jgi:hypothetical protein
VGAVVVKVSHAIMAHPARQQFVEQLQATQLADVPVVWDRANDRWDTGRRSMLAYDPTADWHVVVQDDAVLCRDYLDGVAAALAHVHEPMPVAFYTGRVRPSAQFVTRMVMTAHVLGRAWLQFPGPWWGVSVAIPVECIELMVAWGDANPRIPNYDKRMAAYFESRGVPCRYSLPSLVDHRVGSENPSLIPGRGNAPSRTAHSFIGVTRSPLEVDWDTPPCTLIDRAHGVPAPNGNVRRIWKNRHDGRLRRTILGSPADARYEQDAAEWEVIR